MDSFVDYAKKRIARLSFPERYVPGVFGHSRGPGKSRRDLLVNSLLAGLGIVLLLSVVMGDYRNLLLVLLFTPCASWRSARRIAHGS